MKRFIGAVALMLCVSLPIVGCSSADDKAGTEPAKTETTVDDKSEKESKTEDSNDDNKEAVELTVFSGAGLKKPMEDIKSEFEKANPNVKINYIFAGAGQLLGQMELGNEGDVFVTGSMDSYNTANEKGLVEPAIEIAHHTPVIAVQKGNPKNIKSLEDLTQPGLRIMVGDKEANAIGMTTQLIIEKNNLPGINDNVVATAATINEIVAQFGESGEIDAAIVTKDSIFHNENLDIIEIPEDQNIDQMIPVCVMKNSEHKDTAQLFVDYVASKDGIAAFEKYGFDAAKK